MRRYRVYIVQTLLCLLPLTGCSRGPAEPPGKSVTLTPQEAAHSNSLFCKEAQESLNWLDKARILQDQGKYEEALYCLHRGQEKWPKTDPRPAADQKLAWSENFEPLTKALLYIRMRKPDLALVYLDKLPFKNDRLANFYRATAHYMMKDFENADKELGPEPSLLRGAVLCAKGNEAAGTEMVKTCWAKESATRKSDIARGTYSREHAFNVFWMEHPDEVQALIKRLDPSAPGF